MPHLWSSAQFNRALGATLTTQANAWAFALFEDTLRNPHPAVAARVIETVFLGALSRRFSIPAFAPIAVARRLGQASPKAIAKGDALRP